MTGATNMPAFRRRSAVDDSLTEIRRNEALELLAWVVEIELQAFLATTAELNLPNGRAVLCGTALALPVEIAAARRDRDRPAQGRRPWCDRSRSDPLHLSDPGAVGPCGR